MRALPAVFGVIFAIVLAVVIGVRLSPTAQALVLGVILGTLTGASVTFLVMVLLRDEGRREKPRTQAPRQPEPDIVYVAGEPTRAVFPPAPDVRRLKG